MSSISHRLRARWIVPVDAEPLENATLVIADGRIVDIHTHPDPTAADLGNTALIPGLINAHTHLEFSDLREPLETPQPFTAWIRALVAHRRNRTVAPAIPVSAGLIESARCGTTLLGEIATEGFSPAPFTPDRPRAVVFRELIGFAPEQIEPQLALAREHLASNDPLPGKIVRGISPHAPYSVHPELFHKLVDLAAETEAPLAIHLAETRDELQLLRNGSGAFVTMLEEFGVWQSSVIARGSRPLDYLQALARLPRALVIHGNYLAAEEIEFLARHRQLTVVYCPRTHAYFGHSPHPWQHMLRQGVSLALGTDGRGSNPDLSLWEELKFLHRQHPDIPPDTLLKLGTLHGARALGLHEETGSLTPGKSADLTAIALPDIPSRPPYDLLLHPQSQPQATMRAGKWLSGSPE